MRINFDDMLSEFKRVLVKKGFNEEDALESAILFAETSLDGVYTHGVNRFLKVVEYIDKGLINVEAKAEKVEGIGSLERWTGNLGMGNLNAKAAMNRAIELSKEYGIGMVALKDTNHWMRGGSYGWQAANDGCIGICWTNTMPNMPPWGAKDIRIGNNPFIIAVPRSNGEHVVVDMAMSQFSYGKIEEYKYKEQELPVFGGYDSNGDLTTDPIEIESTMRTLPIGYWKGSGLSLILDLVATVLSGGLSTTQIGKQSNDEYGISQVFIAIDPYKFSNSEVIDSITNTVLEDLKQSSPINDNTNILYPGERVIATRKDNLKNGIPVIESIWNEIKNI